jgi:hypothetical protein
MFGTKNKGIRARWEEWSATKGNMINKGCHDNVYRETRKTRQLPMLVYWVLGNGIVTK